MLLPHTHSHAVSSGKRPSTRAEFRTALPAQDPDDASFAPQRMAGGRVLRRPFGGTRLQQPENPKGELRW